MAIEHSFRDFDAGRRKETFSAKFMVCHLLSKKCDIHSAVSLSIEY